MSCPSPPGRPRRPRGPRRELGAQPSRAAPRTMWPLGNRSSDRIRETRPAPVARPRSASSLTARSTCRVARPRSSAPPGATTPRGRRAVGSPATPQAARRRSGRPAPTAGTRRPPPSAPRRPSREPWPARHPDTRALSSTAKRRMTSRPVAASSQAQAKSKEPAMQVLFER
jgi:hypothetical protein